MSELTAHGCNLVGWIRRLRRTHYNVVREWQARAKERRASAPACPSDAATKEKVHALEFIVHLGLAGHGHTLFAGLSKPLDLKLVSRLQFASRAVAMRYETR
jgi:hypothetical protein